MELILETTIRRHGVDIVEDGLSTMQAEMMRTQSLINVVSAPTGSGKSYVFQKAVELGERVLFIVPTRILGKNQRQSMIDSLTDPRRGDSAWPKNLAEKKVQNWNGEYSEFLREEKDIRKVMDYYASKIASLHPSDKGEIIYCTPELLNTLFLNPGYNGIKGDIGPGFIVNRFDRIVYDEFHTIQERGLGLITVMAAAAKQWALEDNSQRRARFFLLSATPFDLRKPLRTLGFDTDDSNEVKFINEQISENPARILHGDVNVKFVERETIPSISGDIDKTKINKDSKLLIIYDSLRDLALEQEELEEIFRNKRLFFESGLHSQIESVNSGRGKNLDDFEVIVGTSSLEMGITIANTRFLIMEPGHSPMSFIQRIGRIARGDISGQAIVAMKSATSIKWMAEALTLLRPNLGNNSEIAVCEFNRIFQRVSFFERKLNEDDLSNKNFKGLSSRAACCAATYHYLIARRLEEAKRYNYANRMKACQPKQARMIYALLDAINSSRINLRGNTGKLWTEKFLNEATKLRIFPETIRLVMGTQKLIYSSKWVQRNTDIFEKHFVQFDEKGEPFIECSQHEILAVNEKTKRIRDNQCVYLPDGTNLTLESRNLVSQYIERLGGQHHPAALDAFEASSKLVMMTGIVPLGESDDVTGSMSAIF